MLSYSCLAGQPRRGGTEQLNNLEAWSSRCFAGQLKREGGEQHSNTINSLQLPHSSIYSKFNSQVMRILVDEGKVGYLVQQLVSLETWRLEILPSITNNKKIKVLVYVQIVHMYRYIRIFIKGYRILSTPNIWHYYVIVSLSLISETKCSEELKAPNWLPAITDRHGWTQTYGQIWMQKVNRRDQFLTYNRPPSRSTPPCSTKPAA